HSLDLIFYVIGPQTENELMLNAALTAYMDSLSMLLRNQVEKRSVLENLDLALLCLDETIDEGYVGFNSIDTLNDNLTFHRVIVETDSTAIASRVKRQGISMDKALIELLAGATEFELRLHPDRPEEDVLDDAPSPNSQVYCFIDSFHFL
ncbi:16468_t:CDS:2, partial [Acaulospora colombiana]